jgi:hypothetical protein
VHADEYRRLEEQMSKTLRRLAAFGVGAALQGGLICVALAQVTQPSQVTPPSSGPSGTAPQAGAAEALQTAEPAATSETNSSTELPVLYVTSVEVVRTSVDPKLDLIVVRGLTGSAGWTDPQLVPTFAGKTFDDILDMQFIATMPEQSETAQGFVPIAAIFPLQEGHPFKGVRVHASENAVEVNQIPGSNQAAINVNGCADCVGKKFIEKGQAPAGQQGVVRQEDLPKVLRLIARTGGVSGREQNPNRLTLILGADNTIVGAFWE